MDIVQNKADTVEIELEETKAALTKLLADHRQLEMENTLLKQELSHQQVARKDDRTKSKLIMDISSPSNEFSG